MSIPVTVTVVIPAEASPEVRTLALRRVDELRAAGYDILVDTQGKANDHEGEPHHYDIRCKLCGQPGTIRLAIEP